MQRQGPSGLGNHAHAHLQHHQQNHYRLAPEHVVGLAYTHAQSADLGLGSGAYSPYLLPVLGVLVLVSAVLIFIALGLLRGSLPGSRYLYRAHPQWALSPDLEGVDSDYERYTDDPSASSSSATMKVLVATYPYTGHFNPAKPVVEELLRRGHEVVWMTGPSFKDKVLKTGARFAPMSEDALVDDDNIHRIEGKVTLSKMADYLRRLFIARIPAQVNDYHRVVMGTLAAEASGIPRYIPPHPKKADDIDDAASSEYTEPDILPPFAADLLVVDFCTYAARCYMDLTGTPYATLGINPLVTLDPEIPPWGSGLQPPTTRLGLMGIQLLHYMGIFFFISRLSSDFNKVRRQMGLPPRSRWRSYADDVRSPDLHIQMTTPMFEFPRKNMLPSVTFVGPLLPTWQAKPSEDNGDGRDDKSEDWPTPPWWDEMLNHPRERVVHITQGTISVNTDLLVKPTIEALAGRDDLLLIITGKNVEGMFEDGETEELLSKNDDNITIGGDSVSADGGEPPAPKMKRPANVRTAPFVPHLRLLPHVGVMVTNAGYNGTLTALSCGVPLVCAGRSEDKADVSSRVAWSGAGIDLGTAAPTTGAVRAAVLRIVEAGLGAGSRRNSTAINTLEADTELSRAMAAIDKIHGPEHNYRAAAKHIRDDFAQHNPPVEAADALEKLVLQKKTGRRVSHGHPRRSSLKAPKLNRPN
ncbi:udp-glucuronosyl udp-glucosyltransferase [Ophiostoma piceae UAMH 11346]|uniref:Udp-glucuronosyl udp-glucosyltransferase n=1 Tax=Ophiostoma piceae (strain UAMH 11346) TaxID=1262450 RepID=S3CC07_OPHP1|nr:udp-glucuronosyl udp-glucosyltransferase [Ophiostoma piceae UAMH 11346]